MSSNSPRLWVVATPIGNLGDMSPRAKLILGQADLILAEDTRVAGQLLHRLDLQHKGLLSLHAHNEQARVPQVLSQMQQGKSPALISSAGEPLISDPGYLLIRACRAAGYQVSPVPGPCAVTAALIASGLPAHPFIFLGFLPRKSGEITGLLEKFGRLKSTLIFFQRKSRLVESLKLAYNVLGDREVCLARELTKAHEEVISFRLGQWEKMPQVLRGEFTVLLGPGAKSDTKTPDHEVKAIRAREISQGDRAKQIARKISTQVQGWSTKEVYSLLLQIISESDPKSSEY